MNNSIPKVCIIGVYFGKLPDYFKIWLISCKYNPTIDFLIFIDDEIGNVPSNVEVVKFSLENVKKIADGKFGMDCNLDEPYKLCDFKGAYGVIFEDYLSNYDYWGHCDFDMMFGDLRSFFEYYNLEQYDKFMPLGHLSLYKNSYENNRVFMKKLDDYYDYKEVFSDSHSYVFDEIYIPRVYYASKRKFFDKVIFADIYDKIKRYILVENISYYPELSADKHKDEGRINYCHQLFYWSRGKVFRMYVDSDGNVKRNEYIYIHFQKREIKVNIGDDSEMFFISRDSIMGASKMQPDEEDIFLMNPYNGIEERAEILLEFFKHCWSYFKRRVVKIEKNNMILGKK